jgi:hypothetical protein
MCAGRYVALAWAPLDQTERRYLGKLDASSYDFIANKNLADNEKVG